MNNDKYCDIRHSVNERGNSFYHNRFEYIINYNIIMASSRTKKLFGTSRFSNKLISSFYEIYYIFKEMFCLCFFFQRISFNIIILLSIQVKLQTRDAH